MSKPSKAKPSKADPSTPRGWGSDYSGDFYRSETVAEDYDFHRFSTPERQARNKRKWSAILKALAQTSEIKTVLDLPCGTGRFTGGLAGQGYQVVGSDISLEMMKQAPKTHDGLSGSIPGYVQADAVHMPYGDRVFDCVVSIRFMLHIEPATRVLILREMKRVSKRWVVIDYRHRNTLRYAKWRLGKMIGLSRRHLSRVSRRELEEEFRQAGLAVRAIIPVSVPLFSDKWIVLGEHVAP